MEIRRFMTRGDLFLMAGLILFSFTLSALSVRKPHEKLNIHIKVNGETYARIPLNETSEPVRYRIASTYGLNILETLDGKVHIIEASCPDKLDVKQGFISRRGQVIVCLPNRMVVELEGGEEPEVDTVIR